MRGTQGVTEKVREEGFDTRLMRRNYDATSHRGPQELNMLPLPRITGIIDSSIQ